MPATPLEPHEIEEALALFAAGSSPQDVAEWFGVALSEVLKLVPARARRTSASLRDTLFDEIESLRSGDSRPERAHAVAHLSYTILKSVQTEMEWNRMARQHKADRDELLQPIALGAAFDVQMPPVSDPVQRNDDAYRPEIQEGADHAAQS